MYRRLLLAALLLPSAAAAAPVPASVEAMIRAASPNEIGVVARLAKQTHPESAAEIDALAEIVRTQRIAVQTAARQAELRAMGPLDGWTGEGALGGSITTGNTDQVGLSASIALNRQGLDWQHEIDLNADVQETNDVRTRERLFAGYRGRRNVTDRLFFAFGLFSFERDRFLGITYRFTESLGFGWRIFDGTDFGWSVEGGPALRQTDFTNGTQENVLNVLGQTDVYWQIADNLRLTEEAGFVTGQGNSSLFSRSALSATVLGDLSARLSFDVLHETDPPQGREMTDTISRISLVYDF